MSEASVLAQPGMATGVGSMPGADPLAAAAFVLDTVGLPHLPELPDRGAGADAVGRSAAILVDLPVELAADGWQVAPRAGADRRRAERLLADDVAALGVAAHGWAGPLKVQVLGPLSLAAALRQSRGERAVSDPGLRRDLASSLAEGVRQHLASVSVQVPAATLVLQLDEPTLPQVLGGRVPTRSGWGGIAPVEAGEASALLGEVLAAVAEGRRVVHCCAPDVPLEVLRPAGASAISVDTAVLADAGLDAWGDAIDAGLVLLAGAVPVEHPATVDEVVARLDTVWRRWGFPASVRRTQTVVTPACGLAGRSQEQARAAYETARDAARAFAEQE